LLGVVSQHGPINLEADKRPIDNDVMLYRGFPSKLHHAVPHWVEPGALFHVRVALDREKQQRQLTEPRSHRDCSIQRVFMNPDNAGTSRCFY